MTLVAIFARLRAVTRASKYREMNVAIQTGNNRNHLSTARVGTAHV